MTSYKQWLNRRKILQYIRAAFAANEAVRNLATLRVTAVSLNILILATAESANSVEGYISTTSGDTWHISKCNCGMGIWNLTYRQAHIPEDRIEWHSRVHIH